MEMNENYITNLSLENPANDDDNSGKNDFLKGVKSSVRASRSSHGGKALLKRSLINSQKEQEASVSLITDSQPDAQSLESFTPQVLAEVLRARTGPTNEIDSATDAQTDDEPPLQFSDSSLAVQVPSFHNTAVLRKAFSFKYSDQSSDVSEHSRCVQEKAYIHQVSPGQNRDAAVESIFRQASLQRRLRDADIGLVEMRRRWQEAQLQQQEKPKPVERRMSRKSAPNLSFELDTEKGSPKPIIQDSPERQKVLLSLAVQGRESPDNCFDKPSWSNGYSRLMVEHLLPSKEQVDVFGKPLLQNPADGVAAEISFFQNLSQCQTSARINANGSISFAKSDVELKKIFRAPGSSLPKEQRNKWDPEKKKWIKPTSSANQGGNFTDAKGLLGQKERFLYNKDLLLQKQASVFYNMP